MKKTYNINLNSQVFCIDEDACAQLQNYIETLEKYYLAEEDGKEIMADIESRIAELFREFLQKSHKEVISQTEINQVIEIMGTPDVIIDEDSEHKAPRKTTSRKLYRDADNAMLGGVASGLAAYMNISAGWVRLAFIISVFFYGMTAIVYIVLWIVLPKAITAKQKLEMKGENINVSNIEKNIRDTYNDVKKNSKLRHSFEFIGRKLSDFFLTLGEIIGKFLSVIGHILAVIGLLTGIFFFLGSSWVLLFTHHFSPENYNMFLQYACAPISVWLIKLLFFLLFNIPMLLLAYFSAAYLFKFQGHRGTVFLVSTAIWVLTCFASFFLASYYFCNYTQSYEDEVKTSLVTSDTTNRQVNVKFNRLCSPKYGKAINCSLDSYILYCPQEQDQDSALLFLKPRITFEKTNLPRPLLIVEKKANGISGNDAAANTENARYQYEWKNDTLYLNNYFTLFGNKWRMNDIAVRVLIPQNYYLNLENVPRTDISNRTIFRHPNKFLHNTSVIQRYKMEDDKLIEQ